MKFFGRRREPQRDLSPFEAAARARGIDNWEEVIRDWAPDGTDGAKLLRLLKACESISALKDDVIEVGDPELADAVTYVLARLSLLASAESGVAAPAHAQAGFEKRIAEYRARRGDE